MSPFAFEKQIDKLAPSNYFFWLRSEGI